MPISKDILDQLLGQHPAHEMAFDDLYAGLMDRVQKRHIHCMRDADLELFTYTQIVMFEKEWNIFSIISRGLILQPESKRVVATPFPKFFNYGEFPLFGSDEASDKAKFYEKLDGSLGIVFSHNGQWRCATKGSFTSEQAVWGTSHINAHFDLSVLEEGHTYLFEIIYPENQIVVSYDYSGMVLLSAYDDQGFEYDHARLDALANRLGVRQAMLHSINDLAAALEEAERIDKNSEGWVVRFDNGHRIKIKGSEYCRVHKIMSNVTPLGVWDVLLNGDDLEAIRQELAEEYLKDFNKIAALLEAQIEDILEDVAASLERYKDLENKEVGLSIKNGQWPDGKDVSEIESQFFFSARNSHNWPDYKADNRFKTSLFRYIKPKGNDLEGYVPSHAIDRFQNESG